MLAALAVGMAAWGVAPAAPGAVAVVELFTSEGCSSCPPADALLNAIGEAARKDGVPVYALAFHVDYWDRLGWPDPFARPEYTRRQAGYGDLYTPEMVVNGTTAFTGSDRDRAEKAIAAALARPAPVDLKVTAKRDGSVTVTLPKPPSGARLAVALAEDGLVVDVQRGENGGRTLRHDAVVRAFATAAPAATVQLSLSVPPDLHPDRARVVAWVQDEASHAVLGAAATPLR
jgi:hypothetical protein